MVIILSLFLAFIFVRLFIFGFYIVPSSSMEPNIMPKDVLMSNKLAYGLKIPFTKKKIFKKEIKRGDIVTFRKNNILYVKRIIGLPGEKIQLDMNELIIDGKIISYQGKQENLFGIKYDIKLDKSLGNTLCNGQLLVPKNEYFLMGDFRDNSLDSRVFGCIKEGEIKSKIIYRLFNMVEDGRKISKF